MGANASYSGEITPSDATMKELDWSVQNNTGSATINSKTGELTPTSAGSIWVMAKATDGSDKNARLNVTIENVVTPDKPTITAGAGSTHQISDGKDMTFTCSGKLEDLTGIYVDGKLVEEKNYTKKSGSTILTLKASYLDTLSAGKHTLKFQYKDNISAETDFTITAKAGATPAKTNSPKTGDTSNTMLYLSLIVLSGCVVGFGFKKKKAFHK